jgi:hypothetical protein
MSPGSTRLFVSYFESEEAILAATRAAREEGYAIHDVFTPYAVHGLDEAMGLRRSRLSYVCFAAGMVGVILAIVFQWWASAINWPLNIGGKPHHSFPSYIPIGFEMMVLVAGLTTVLALFIRARLRPLKKPKILLPRVTDDRFALVLDTEGTHFDTRKATALCERFGAVETQFLEVAS